MEHSPVNMSSHSMVMIYFRVNVDEWHHHHPQAQPA